MRATLYVVPASHPCAAVAKALELKDIPYRRIDLPPGLHAAHQRLRFGRRTVPSLRMGRRDISGSREIMRALDIVRPDPPLLPVESRLRSRVLEAEAWGDEVLQNGVRRILWGVLPRDPHAAMSYLEGAKVPVPAGVAERSMPALAWVERRLNNVSEEAVRDDLAALPAWLDRVDGWIADGVLGGVAPNAADLQIGSGLRLLATIEDLRGRIEERPAGMLAFRVFPAFPGRMPAGAVPPGWLP